jgi:hypothetical protein
LPYWEVSVVVLWSSIVADNLIMPCIVASILIYDSFPISLIAVEGSATSWVLTPVI